MWTDIRMAIACVFRTKFGTVIRAFSLYTFPSLGWDKRKSIFPYLKQTLAWRWCGELCTSDWCAIAASIRPIVLLCIQEKIQACVMLNFETIHACVQVLYYMYVCLPKYTIYVCKYTLASTWVIELVFLGRCL